MRRYTLGLRGREIVVDVQELGADRFDVVVGGERYEVSLTGDENLAPATISPAGGFETATGPMPLADAPAAPAPPRSSRASALASRPPSLPSAPKRAAAGGAGSQVLMAPMPGTILQFHVRVGDSVARGQPVAVLEAMKMHNTIGAPRAAVVSELCVEPGQAVGHGDPIVRFQA